MTAALDEAATLGKQAATLTADPARWEAALAEALLAVKRAEGLLNNGEGAEELRERVAALREELEAADKDRRMVARLEEARLQGAVAGKESGFDYAREAVQYAAAFEEDMRLRSLSADRAAEGINKRAIREELLAALADWSNITPNQKDQQRLRGILKAADPDVTTFRNRWNAAMAQKDWDGLRHLAFGPEASTQPAARVALLGKQLTEAGSAADAVQLLKKVNEQRPGDFWIIFELAHGYSKMKPPAMDEAIRLLTAAVALRPGSPVAHTKLGFALYNKGQGDEAIAEYRQALQIQPDFAVAHCNLGFALYNKGQLDEAIAQYRQALQIQPDNALVHIALGILLDNKGQLDEAITEYRQALQIRPGDADPHIALGNVLYKKGQVDEAIAEYRQALQIRPADAEPHNDLGNVLYKKGQVDEAIAEYRQALQIQPDNAVVHNVLANVLYKKGQVDEAIAEYRQALQIQPDNAVVHNVLATALYNIGQVDEAITEYRQALQIQPDNAVASCGLGLTLRDQGRFTESLAALRRCHELGMMKPGWSYPSADWVREAEQWVRLDALLPTILKGEAEPSSPAVKIQFARLCGIKHQYAVAARFYSEAFVVQPALAEDLSAGNRYSAACAVVLAVCSKGEDAAAINNPVRTHWRQQAQDWLRADLALWMKRIIGSGPDDRAVAAKGLQHWQEDSDLAGVRDQDALAKLPADEQEAWRKLWTDVDALRNKAEKK